MSVGLYESALSFVAVRFAMDKKIFLKRQHDVTEFAAMVLRVYKNKKGQILINDNDERDNPK